MPPQPCDLSFAPLGDQAVLAQARAEADALAFARAVRHHQFPWAEDVVLAYMSVAVFYRADAIDYFQARERLATLSWQNDAGAATGTLHLIPCCYELGLDFDQITHHTSLTRDQVVSVHSAATYTVYAIGFCPGFPYLGYLPDNLAGVPRLESPRLKVEAG